MYIAKSAVSLRARSACTRSETQIFVAGASSTFRPSFARVYPTIPRADAYSRVEGTHKCTATLVKAILETSRTRREPTRSHSRTRAIMNERFLSNGYVYGPRPFPPSSLFTGRRIVTSFRARTAAVLFSLKRPADVLLYRASRIIIVTSRQDYARPHLRAANARTGWAGEGYALTIAVKKRPPSYRRSKRVATRINTRTINNFLIRFDTDLNLQPRSLAAFLERAIVNQSSRYFYVAGKTISYWIAERDRRNSEFEYGIIKCATSR